MRLVHVVPTYASYRVFLRELAQAVVAAGHDAAVVCGGLPQGVGPIDSAGVRLLSLEMPRGSHAGRHWMAARRLRRILKEWQPDVVHAHFSAGIFCTALALRRGDPWVSLGTFQGLSFPLSKGPTKTLIRAAETFASTRFDTVHVLTADDFELLRHAAPSARVELQGGYGFGCEDRFVDTPLPSADERHALRRAAGVSEEGPVLIFVGRLTQFKGFAVAVRAFWRLCHSMPEAQFVVLGEVDPLHPTGLSRDEWRRYTRDDNIIRAGRQDDVMPWLDLADVMVFPSEREGVPVCVMEALARGLPVVAAPSRGSRELVVEGRNGHFVADRSERAWEERLSMVITGLIARRREAQDGCQRFRRSLWVGETMNIYAKALEGRRSSLLQLERRYARQL